ncbi:MAG: PilZ domain-containing protein [Candidatus Omnitrophica bacterium]|nr:PilZ domain-containing protein [Candidatus Omnitrophota bacterium]
MEERRQTHRWRVMRDAKLQTDEDDRVVDCCVRDINFKGMQIAMSEKLPQQASYKMDLLIDQVLNLAVEAVVPWHRQEEGQHVYGLSFRRIADEDKTQIYQYVSSHFPHQLREQWWGHG